MPLFPLSETEAKFNLFRYKAGKKRTATQFLKTVWPIYYWMIFTPWALNSYWRCSRMAACAAARRAIGTRNGLQET